MAHTHTRTHRGKKCNQSRYEDVKAIGHIAGYVSVSTLTALVSFKQIRTNCNIVTFGHFGLCDHLCAY